MSLPQLIRWYTDIHEEKMGKRKRYTAEENVRFSKTVLED
jgi:hypothetical protein